MSFLTEGRLKILEAMGGFTQHPEYDSLPESIKMLHTPQQYMWLGEERNRIIERETQPDWDVTE